jgi:hypothetical protein
MSAAIGGNMKRKYLLTIAQAAALLCMAMPAVAAETASKPASAEAVPDYDAFIDAALPAMAKESKLIAVLMDRVPAFNDQLRARLKAVMTSTPQHLWLGQMHGQTQALVQYYLNIYMPKASDESIYAMISLDKEYLDSYATRPDLCVGYALGTMEFMLAAPKDYVTRVNDLKSKVILSALDAPSDRVMPASLDGVREMIFKVYEKNGYPLADLALLGSLGTAPPADACRAYSNFNNAMHSMGVKDGAYVMAVLTNAAPKITP